MTTLLLFCSFQEDQFLIQSHALSRRRRNLQCASCRRTAFIDRLKSVMAESELGGGLIIFPRIKSLQRMQMRPCITPVSGMLPGNE